MRKEVQISDGRTIKMECNAATPIVGKRIFNFDLLSFFNSFNDMEFGERLEKFEMVAFTMAMQAEKSLKEALTVTEDDYIEWLASLEFDDLTNLVLPVATELWGAGQTTSSQPKNAKGPQ